MRKKSALGLKTKMADWTKKLDEFLKISEKNLLHSAGSIRAKETKEKATAEFEKYRTAQDKKYISDFDLFAKKLLKKAKK